MRGWVTQREPCSSPPPHPLATEGRPSNSPVVWTAEPQRASVAWSKDLLLQSAILPDQQKRAHACLSASVGMSAWADSGLRAYPGGGGGRRRGGAARSFQHLGERLLPAAGGRATTRGFPWPAARGRPRGAQRVITNAFALSQ